MLHEATRLPDAADYRSGVLAALGVPFAGARDQAQIAACAIPQLPEGAGICLGMPVHAVAGMSRMFLAEAGALRLDAAGREQLRQAFNSEFGSPDLTLHAVGTGWILQAPFAAAASDADPELLQGRALSREPAASAAGKLLRRLGAETEMWLATLPFNMARERRGDLPVNSIWFWNGTTSCAAPVPARTPAGIFSTAAADAFIAGLAACCGLPVQQAQSWQELPAAAGALVILQPAQSGDTASQLMAWDRAWLAPVRRDMATGHLTGLRLQLGATAWRLPAPRYSRWFRRSRPWWQLVSA
jgi:hypothetical protein